MSYGNGSEVAYTYDVFGNISAMSYDGTEVVRNYTDSAGNINRTQDLLTNLEHRVTYDSTGRLISKEVLDLTATGDRWLRSLEYNYDLNNNVTYISYADKQGSNITQYEYGLDNLPEKTILNNGKEVTYTYDTLGRLTGKVLNTTTPLNFAYTYEASDRGSGYTTTKVETEQIGDTTYKYTYDDYGNIEDTYRVNSNNTETLLCSYVYDSYNQLTTVNDYEHSEQTTYTYDESGNITRKYVQNLHPTNGSPIGVKSDVTYTYGDSEWKDLLTTYDGQTITYDAIGNPLSYRDGISLTWQKGRQLASYSDSNNNITYTYDASGMRTGKVVTTSSGATTNYSYVYENGLLQKMTRGSRILEFSYDASGNPVSIKYRSSASANPVYYYYGVNSRGDVIGLYNANGALSSTYEYDAYGKLLSVKTPAGIEITSETAIANLNPLRYRGYVYDNETGFYYLQTRYYDPTTCRFINADGYNSTGHGILGNNMFAYCNNNPVMYSDPTGEMCIREAGGGGLYGYCGSFSAWGGYSGGGSGSAYSSVNSIIVIATTVAIIHTVADLRAEMLLIREYEAARAKERVDAAPGNNSEDSPQYWSAELINKQVIPIEPLSYSEARVWVDSGGDLLCKNHGAAYAIVKFYPSVKWDRAHGRYEDGYLDHYHLSSAHTNHIWYY